MGKYRPRMIGVATTCLTETIGDDVPGILFHFKRENANGGKGSLPHRVQVSTPSYSGTHMEGFHGAVRAVVDQTARKLDPWSAVNVLPGFVSPADVRHLKEIMADFCLPSIVLPDISETMDGPALDDYEKIPAGGTPLAHIRNMGGSRATIEWGRTLEGKDSAGSLLHERFAVPHHLLGMPVGLRETDRFFALLETLAGKPVPEKHVLERGRLVDAYVDGHKYLFGKGAVLFGEEDLVVGPAELGVTHMTLTINAVDPRVGKEIYGWVRDGKVIYRGMDGAELLIVRRLDAVRRLKEKGILVKVNTIIVPGINDEHAADVARAMGEMGVDLHNCMAVFPNKDTPFEHLEEPSAEKMAAIRERAGKHVPQMFHCTRCRADAVGLLGEDRSGELGGCLSACSTLPPSAEERHRTAVATREGILVNRHLGEARSFQIWEERDGEFRLVGEREAPPPGGGLQRWRKLAEILQDCRAVLVSGVGENPGKVLSEAGILPVEMDGFIDMGLRLIYHGGNLRSVKKRRSGGCAKGAGCGGDGTGC